MKQMYEKYVAVVRRCMHLEKKCRELIETQPAVNPANIIIEHTPLSDHHPASKPAQTSGSLEAHAIHDHRQHQEVSSRPQTNITPPRRVRIGDEHNQRSHDVLHVHHPVIERHVLPAPSLQSKTRLGQKLPEAQMFLEMMKRRKANIGVK